MKKQIINVLIIIFIGTFLAGCGVKNITELETDNKKVQDIPEKKIKENYKYYSNDNMGVYYLNNEYYMIYYHDGDTINKLEYIYYFDTVEQASKFKSEYRDNYSAEEIDDLDINDKKVTVTYNKSVYEDLTYSTIEKAYNKYKVQEGQ